MTLYLGILESLGTRSYESSLECSYAGYERQEIEFCDVVFGPPRFLQRPQERVSAYRIEFPEYTSRIESAVSGIALFTAKAGGVGFSAGSTTFHGRLSKSTIPTFLRGSVVLGHGEIQGGCVDDNAMFLLPVEEHGRTLLLWRDWPVEVPHPVFAGPRIVCNERRNPGLVGLGCDVAGIRSV